MDKTKLQGILTWYSSGKLKNDEAVEMICALAKSSNENSGLNIPVVVQQRELLIDFYYKLGQRLDTNLPPITIDKIVDMYEKGNL
jgi:hypothetical protein